MKIRHIIYALGIILFISCNREKNENNINSKILSIDLNNLDQNVHQQLVIDSVLYIPLETDTNCLISDIVKIIYSDNKFFILDRINRNGIMVFSDEGTFITTIGTIGRGPSEFIHLSNFDVKDDKVYIYDKSLKEMKAYDLTGDFIQSFKIPNIQYDFSIIDSSKILRFWVGSPSENWKQVTIYDLFNNRYSNDIPISNIFNNKHASPYYELSNHLYRSDDNIYFNTYFTNIIYRTINDSISSFLKIESKELIGKKDIKRLIRNNYEGGDKIARDNIILLSDIFQAENILTFSIKNKNPRKIMYNIKSKNVICNTNLFKNEKLIDISKIYGVKNSMFFSVIHPQLFQEKENINKNYLNYFINSKHSKYFIERGANSNPVIVLFNFNEF